MKTNLLSDARLVESYRNGDVSAFEVLLDRYKAKVYTSIYYITKDRYVAEDLLQEVFIKVINRIRQESYTEEGKFGPWIMRIAYNIAVDHYRKNKRVPIITGEDGHNILRRLPFAAADMESVLARKEFKTALRGLIDGLPDNQREVLVMRIYFDMSFQEIAEVTQVSINTALGRMRYALLNLRKKIEKLQTNPYAYDTMLYHRQT